MNFSDIIQQTSGIVKYSPNGDLVAVAKTFEVKIYETNSLRPMHSYSFVDVVSHIDWSFDSNMILIGIAKRSLAFVKSLHDNDWNCKIDEGMAGMTHCRWGPLANHIITVSDFKVRMTVWCLVDKSVQYIRNPKFEDHGLAFSPNKKLMALAERTNEGKDSIGIYDVTKNQFECLYHFTPDTFDLEDLQFAGDGQHLIVWDTNLKCKIAVYQINFSQQGGIASVQPVVRFSPYENTALGVRSLKISKNNQYIMAGFFDQKLRFYNQLSWKEIYAFDHSVTELDDENTPKDLNIYIEIETRDGGSVYENAKKPFKINTLQAHQLQHKSELPKVGISLIAISHDQRYVATKNEICPNIVWIWDIQRLALNTVMVQKNEVTDLTWCPKMSTLNVSTSNGKLYLWKLRLASVCQVPISKESFYVNQVMWNPNGKSFAALDKNGLVFVYPELGLGIIPEWKSKLIYPYQHLSKTFVWRSRYLDGYKIGGSFKDQPVDLSNYLLVRTRERLLLENKIVSPQNVLKNGKENKLTKQTSLMSLNACREDLSQNLPFLSKLLFVANEKVDFPVAFASNTLYVLERNGGNHRVDYERVLLPVLRKKIDYLHAEGVAQSVWALANAEIWDSQIWEGLKMHIENKDFGYVVVKNARWSSTNFQTHNGNEHIFQSELSQFANDLFFQDNINLFELYNGLQKAHSQNKELKLDESIKLLENKYGGILSNNNQFLEIERTSIQELHRISAQGQSNSKEASHI